MIWGGALGVEKGSLEKVSKLCSGLSKWTSISGHLTLIVPVRVCMHARVCVYVCVCTMVMNGFTVREREKQEERKQSFNRAQYQTADRQRTAGRFWKGEKSLPPSHFSSQRRLPKCPPSNTNTLIHTHINGTITLYPQSISAMKTHPSSVMLMGGFWGLEGVEDRGKTEGM